MPLIADTIEGLTAGSWWATSPAAPPPGRCTLTQRRAVVG